MSNVIRLTFGLRPGTEPPAPPVGTVPPLRVYGDAAGLTVMLVEDHDAPGGTVLTVVVAALPGDIAEAVAILPRTAAGEIDADLVGMAVLRALALIA